MSNQKKVMESIRILEKIEKYVDSQSKFPLTNSIFLSQKHLNEKLKELRLALPKAFEVALMITEERERMLQDAEIKNKNIVKEAEDIKEKQLLEVNKEASQILEDAKNEADATVSKAIADAKQIVENAKNEALKLLDENEILRKAKIKANEIAENASAEYKQTIIDAQNLALQMKSDSYDFVEIKLRKLEEVIEESLNNFLYTRVDFINSVEKTFNFLVGDVRKELNSAVHNKNLFIEFKHAELEKASDNQEEEF